MESSNVIIDNIIDDIAKKLIMHCYERTIDIFDVDRKRYEVKDDIKKIMGSLLYCKENDILNEDIIKIQNIIKEKDEKIKELQDININLTTKFNRLLDKLHE